MVFVEDRLALAGSAKYYADPDKVQIFKSTMIFIYNNWFEKCVYVKVGGHKQVDSALQTSLLWAH